MGLKRQFKKSTGGMSIGIFLLAAVVILLLQIYATTLTAGQTVAVIFATAALVIGFLRITRKDPLRRRISGRSRIRDRRRG